MRKQFEIPYGHSSVFLEIEEDRLAGILESQVNSYLCKDTQENMVEYALDHPIGSPGLEELAQGKKTAVIITSDHTRPLPSRITLSILLRRLRSANPGMDISILVATGYHRASSKDELHRMFGTSVVDYERIVMHDSRDESAMVHLGRLPSGGELWINRLAVETDLLIAEGFIEPHFFAGFSGGRKSVLPGIAGYQTVLANHCSKFIASEFSRTGILDENPIHRDMIFAARKAGLAFILNVVLNGDKRIIRAFAGDREAAHLEGCRFLGDLCRVPRIEADIVVASNGGYPLDQNVYQAVKGMTAAEACCKPGGVIVMISECSDGHGGQSFFENLKNAADAREILDRVAGVSMEETVPDQWEFQILARILDKHSVILVSDKIDPAVVTAMHMEHAFNIQEALERAFSLMGKSAKVTVIPDGVGVIVGDRD
ncbi:nickel-dependent lactate racemase [bacterium]|nr:nickel-dependent lactate racemase [bacterium]